MDWSWWVAIIIALAVVFGFFDNKHKKRKEKINYLIRLLDDQDYRKIEL